MRKIFIILLAISLLVSCNKAAQQAKTEEKVVVVPGFSSDSAYIFIQKQVDFGARVPNTVRMIIVQNTCQRNFGALVLR